MIRFRTAIFNLLLALSALDISPFLAAQDTQANPMPASSNTLQEATRTTNNPNAAESVLCSAVKKLTQVDAAEITRDRQSVDHTSSYVENNVLPLLRANWYRLVTKSGGRKSCQITVEFTIQQDGSLGATNVATGSGDTKLDQIALKSLEDSGPFPALPEEVNGQSISLRSNFSYEPDENISSSGHSDGNMAYTATRFGCGPNETDKNESHCITPPRAISSPDPEFSAEATQMKVQGVVTLSVVVGASGNVQTACVLHALGNGLDEKAVETIRQWKFDPATKDGKSVASKIVIEVDFHLYTKEANNARIEKSPDTNVESLIHTADPIETVYNFGLKGVTTPKAIYIPSAEYSDEARRKKIQGTVGLSLVVTAEGTVRDAKVTTSLDPGLDKQAILCVNKWRFEPAIKDGKPVAVHMAAQVQFRLY